MKIKKFIFTGTQSVLKSDPIHNLLTDDYGVVVSSARSSVDKTIKVSWLSHHRDCNAQEEELQVMG